MNLTAMWRRPLRLHLPAAGFLFTALAATVAEENAAPAKPETPSILARLTLRSLGGSLDAWSRYCDSSLANAGGLAKQAAACSLFRVPIAAGLDLAQPAALFFLTPPARNPLARTALAAQVSGDGTAWLAEIESVFGPEAILERRLPSAANDAGAPNSLSSLWKLKVPAPPDESDRAVWVAVRRRTALVAPDVEVMREILTALEDAEKRNRVEGAAAFLEGAGHDAQLDVALENCVPLLKGGLSLAELVLLWKNDTAEAARQLAPLFAWVKQSAEELERLQATVDFREERLEVSLACRARPNSALHRLLSAPLRSARGPAVWPESELAFSLSAPALKPLSARGPQAAGLLKALAAVSKKPAPKAAERALEAATKALELLDGECALAAGPSMNGAWRVCLGTAARAEPEETLRELLRALAALAGREEVEFERETGDFDGASCGLLRVREAAPEARLPEAFWVQGTRATFFGFGRGLKLGRQDLPLAPAGGSQPAPDAAPRPLAGPEAGLSVVSGMVRPVSLLRLLLDARDAMRTDELASLERQQETVGFRMDIGDGAARARLVVPAKAAGASARAWLWLVGQTRGPFRRPDERP